VDVGANIGMQTIYGHLSGHFDRVISVEASSKNFRILEFNIRENGFENRTWIFHCAAGRTPGQVPFFLDLSNCAKGSLVCETNSFEMVERRPLDFLVEGVGLRPSNIGMVWIDVMGSEVEALAGMPGIIDAAPPLVLEFADRMFGPCEKKEIRALLNGRYSRYIDLKCSRLSAYPLEEICAFSKRWTNLLFM
jgi:FkbM family methyltransferase